MMAWHIVCIAGPGDRFAPVVPKDEPVLRVPFNVPGDADSIESSVPEMLAECGLTPATPAVDLLNATMAAYTADVRVPRQSGYDGWTRDIVLYLAVAEITGWAKGTRLLEEILSFLTGDHWSVQVRQVPVNSTALRPRAVRHKYELSTTSVCLFSGGLDSYIGAVDLLEQEPHPIALVGHHAKGGGSTSASQNKAIAAVRQFYPEARTPFLRLWVSPPKGTSRTSEITTRGRSILFFGLGITVASSLRNARLNVPENGLISLNVPLTASRLGSFSTRTTHPYLITLLRELLSELGIAVEITLPYRFRTKGEMISQCARQEAVAPGLLATMSCSHPGAGRFQGLPIQHCGYCIPCLIRRASIAAATLADPTTYTVTDLLTGLPP